MANRKQLDYHKISINIPTVIYEELKKRCETYGMSITNEVLNLVRQGLQQEQAMENLPKVLKELSNLKKDTSKTKIKASKS